MRAASHPLRLGLRFAPADPPPPHASRAGEESSERAMFFPPLHATLASRAGGGGAGRRRVTEGVARYALGKPMRDSLRDTCGTVCRLCRLVKRSRFAAALEAWAHGMRDSMRYGRLLSHLSRIARAAHS